jgi:hypothetical protein
MEVCAAGEHPSIARALISAGADIEAQDWVRNI